MAISFFKPKAGENAVENRPIIDLQNVNKFYKTAVGDYHALKEVGLQIEAGEFVSIIGKSGSGKTTLLNMITGIDRPSDGEVWVNGTGVHGLNENRMARWRGKNLGIVFQFFQLLPMISVLENIMLPMDFCRMYTLSERRKRAMELLELVELADHAHKLPTALSGGQQQRVAIARALANDPPVVIADEPTGNLDSKTAESVFALFNDLVAKGKTIIIVTHDSALAKRTHRTALIADGEIVNEYVAKAIPTLTPSQLLQATKLARIQSHDAGAMILAEGTNADTFYIVSKGTVEVILPRANQSDVIAVQLGPGKVFGEMEFFHEMKHRASVRASEAGPVEVIAIGYEQLSELLDQSEVTREALRQMADRHQGENLSWRGVASW
ncbi:MAG: ATP-binding cassette domain-containing protein [Anaerolineaceae bacterium]|jgi:ABC-type lipoprotein export system ATPase subunit|nr:MAG: ATP-binding cassette domain-containing protein [Anaerolineaceae bacterium]